VVSLYHSKALIKLHVKVKQYHFSGAHPASYAVGTGSFLGVKRPGHGTDYPPPRLKKEQSYISTPPLGLRGLL